MHMTGRWLDGGKGRNLPAPADASQRDRHHAQEYGKNGDLDGQRIDESLRHDMVNLNRKRAGFYRFTIG